MTENIVSKSEFAKLIGKKPAYVSQLKNLGRLVLTDDGKKVLVAESLALIDATKDLSKTGVVERHAKERAEKAQSSSSENPNNSESDLVEADLKPIGNIPAFVESKARREFFLAQKMEQEFKQLTGELLLASDVKASVMQSDSMIRGKLESMPMMLAPLLAHETDMKRIESTIEEFVERILDDLSKSLKKMGHE